MDERGRFEELARLFDELVDLPPAERRSRLDALRSSDPALCEQLEGLLARDAAMGGEQEAGSPPGGTGRMAGPYRIVERIGQGGMGEVYRAVRADGEFARTVAIKTMRRDVLAPGLLERFRKEREIHARLEHPNIARLLDSGVTDGNVPFLAVEFVDGEAITTWCDARRLSIEDRLRLFQVVCRAIEHAHRNLVVHRDLKPSNILVTPEGEVKILDFGIAKLLRDDAGDRDAAPRTLLPALTPRYASPEQVQGGAITTATDVYALGLLLYELLCGVPAQDPDPTSLEDIQRRVCVVEPVRPSEAVGTGSPAEIGSRVVDRGAAGLDALRARLRGDLDVIVSTALAKEPARRYASATALAEDVARHLSGLPIAARPATWSYRTGKFLGRHRWAVAAAAMVTVSLLGGTVASLVAMNRARRAERAATAQARLANRISDFMVEVFRASDPAASNGTTVTARELLDRATGRIDAGLGDEPEVKARLLRAMARAYRQLGLYEPAEALTGQALDLARGGGALPDLEEARILLDLSVIRGTRGDHDGARKAARQALRLVEKAPDAGARDLVAALGELGKDEARAGDLGKGALLLERAIAVGEERLGSTAVALWSPLNNLATIRWIEHRTDDAAGLYERSLQVARAAFGERHPNVAHTLNNLALVQAQAGRPADAITTHEQALAIREGLLGPDHPDVAETLNNLASLLVTTGNHEKARTCAARALAIRLETFGPEHAAVATSRVNLGLALLNLGELDEARAEFAAARDIFERVAGADHPWTAHALLGLARVARERGDDGRADELYAQVLEIRRKALPPGHPDLVSATEEYEEFLEQAGRTEEKSRPR